MKTTLAYLLSTGLFSCTIIIILSSCKWYISIDNLSLIEQKKPSSSAVVYIQENKQSIPSFDHSPYYLPHENSYLAQIIQKKLTPLKSPDSLLLKNLSIPITKQKFFKKEGSEVDGFQILKKDFLDSQLEIFGQIGQMPLKSKINRKQFAVIQILNYQTGKTENHTLALRESFNDLHQKQWDPFDAQVIIRKGGWLGGSLIQRSSNQAESQKKILEIIENHLNWATFEDGYYKIRVQK